MTESQKLRLEMVAVQREMGTATGSELTEMEARFHDLQEKQIKAEAAEHGELDNASFPDLSPEARALVERADIGAILSCVADHRMTEGPERELQSELRVAGDVVPWALIEKRAAATFTANTGQAGVGGYVGQAFADSIAAFVGCQVV